MFFDLEAALVAVTHLGSRAQTALQALMPGGVTVLLPNPEHCFPLASGADPDTLGLRVVSVPVLSGVRVPVMQSSANLAGDADARRLEEVPELLRAGVDLVIDGGELPGRASTVVDLRRYEQGGIDAVRVLRQGAVSDADVAAALDPAFHFNPDTYGDMIRADLPGFDVFQDTTVAATGREARRILELGTVLAKRPNDCSSAMHRQSSLGSMRARRCCPGLAGCCRRTAADCCAAAPGSSPAGPVRPGRERLVRAPSGRR